MEPIEFNEGWAIVEKGLRKIDKTLAEEEVSQIPFNTQECMMLYDTVYSMCAHLRESEEERLYEKYKENFNEYLSSVVLPSLQAKQEDNESLLREFVKRWANHKLMMRWKKKIFCYLDRYYVRHKHLPDLTQVGLMSFVHQVYEKIKDKVRDAVLFLIDQERDGERIDAALLREVVGIFVEIGEKTNSGRIMERSYYYESEYYERDLEAAMLERTAAYYHSRKLSLEEEDKCLKLEEERVSRYLHSSTVPVLIERVQQALSTTTTTQPI